MSIAIAIATMGRPLELAQAVAALQRQAQPAAQVIVSASRREDVGTLVHDASVTVVYGPPGLCAQRNRVFDLLRGVDLVAFFDDDYLPSQRALQNADAFFQSHPDVVGANGVLLADGINSAGVSY